MKKFFLSTVSLVFLFLLFSSRSVAAGCDPAVYSRWDTYVPGPGGVCGATEGKPDCLNSDNKCWQYITKKEDTSCPSGFRDLFSPSTNVWDDIFWNRCNNPTTYPKRCCLSIYGGCKMYTISDPVGFLQDPNFCQNYYNDLVSTDYKTYCAPPAHYNTSEPVGQQCTSASSNRTLPPAGGSGVPLTSPGGWFGRINTGGAVSPGGGLDFFSNKLVPFLINVGLVIITILSLFFILLSGIRWITSGGDKEALTKAKGTLTYALIGLSLAFSVFIILKIIGSIFNVKFF